MKSARGWIIWMVGFAVLSAVMFALVTLGSPDYRVFPSSLSDEPGGTVGLYKAVQAAGLEARRLFAEPSANDHKLQTVVIFTSDFSTVTKTVGDSEISVRVESLFEKDFSQAENIVLVELPAELPPRRSASTGAIHTDLRAFDRIKLVGPANFSSERGDEVPIVRQSSDRPLVSYRREGSQNVYIVYAGAMLLNRFIKTGDNADFAVALLRAITPKGGAVVFPEYIYGIRQTQNIFTRLGPSYSAALVQIGLMFALAIYALGKRFGYPEVDIPAKPSGARFFVAMGQAYRRKKCTDIVLETVVDRALRQACRKFAIPADLQKSERLKRVPGPLGARLREAWEVRLSKPPIQQTVAMIEEIEKLLKEIS